MEGTTAPTHANGAAAIQSVAGALNGSASAERESAFEQQLHGLSFTRKQLSAHRSSSPNAAAADPLGTLRMHSDSAICEADMVDIFAVPVPTRSGSKHKAGKGVVRLDGEGNAHSRESSLATNDSLARRSRVMTDQDWERFDFTTECVLLL